MSNGIFKFVQINMKHLLYQRNLPWTQGLKARLADNTYLNMFNRYLPNTGLNMFNRYLPNTGLNMFNRYLPKTGLNMFNRYLPNTGLNIQILF